MTGSERKYSLDSQYGNWPTNSQEVLIRAAVLNGPACADAWREWLGATEFDDIEYESFRMIALIYHNLTKHGEEDPNLPRMKGIFRRTWYKNQVLLNRLTDVVRLFHENDLEMLVIKGAPISVLYYENTGSRQMYDLDILVKPGDVRRSIKLLRSAGWEPIVPDVLNRSSICLNAQYATPLKDDSGIELDLHWYAIKSCRFNTADREFWSRSVPVQIRDVETRTLDATGHLLHMCVHGIASHNTSPLRWVTDAVTIMNSDVEIDWLYLEREISRRELNRQMRDALRYLSANFGAPIPDSFLERLDTNRVRRRENWELWASTRITKRSIAAIVNLWATYARRAKGNGRNASFIGFVSFLRCIWEVETSWALPFLAIKKLMRRFAGSMNIQSTS